MKYCWCLVVCTLVSTVPLAAPAHPPPPAPSSRIDPIAETRIHIPPGFRLEGKPRVYSGPSAGRLRVRIVDRSTGEPTHARVNVVGSDGNYYEPRDNVLANWSLFRTGNRLGKGPFRYYGWFFYTPGTFEVEVPPGVTRVEAWKGFEYLPVQQSLELGAGQQAELVVTLERTVAMHELGYYSGDTHVHLPRADATDDARALDLMACEDIRYGYMLSANDGRGYSGQWQRQVIAPQRHQGPASIVRRGEYEIASGQEYVTASYGHLGLIMQKRMVLEGLTVDPNRWPLLGMLGEEARELGGYSFNLHGGYNGEIYVDFAQQATDGVELLQFADYRGIGLEGWYHMLNIGCRFPAVGACDYPYCRALGDCRTYVYSPQKLDAAEWVRRAAAGHSFFTTGPLVLLEVDGRRPGETIARKADESPPLRARVRVRSEVAKASEVELVVNGESVVRRNLPQGKAGAWFEFEESIDVDGPLWIAARCQSKSPIDQPDARAHTNPVFVTVDGRLPYHGADLDWLVGKVDEVTHDLEHRDFPEKAKALEFYRASKAALEELRRSGGRKPGDASAK